MAPAGPMRSTAATNMGRRREATPAGSSTPGRRGWARSACNIPGRASTRRGWDGSCRRTPSAPPTTRTSTPMSAMIRSTTSIRRASHRSRN